jgi:hypothetical protein
MKNSRVVYLAEKQSNLTNIATDIAWKFFGENARNLPKVSIWSHSRQVDAFYTTVDLIIADILSREDLAYDANARSGTLFWSLTLLYPNNKKFAIATHAAKRTTSGRHFEIGSWFEWLGTETNPAVAVAYFIPRWERSSASFPVPTWNKLGLKELSQIDD